SDLRQQLDLGRRWGWGRCFFFALHGVHHLHDHEDGGCYNQEVDDVLNEKPVVQCYGRRFTHCIFEQHLVLGEVHAPQQYSDRRHQDVVNKRGDNLAEGGADHYTDGEIHHIASHGKFFEFFPHRLMCLVYLNVSDSTLRNNGRVCGDNCLHVHTSVEKITKRLEPVIF